MGFKMSEQELDFQTWCTKLQEYANSIGVGDAVEGNEESFKEYYDEDYAPEDAMREDISYWDND